MIDALPGDVVRLAPDEALVLGRCDVPGGDAIVFRDAGWMGLELDEAGIAALAQRHCAFALGDARPASVRGALAGIPCVLRLATDGRALLLVPAPLAADLAERIA
jgi:hypothetical protein